MTLSTFIIKLLLLFILFAVMIYYLICNNILKIDNFSVGVDFDYDKYYNIIKSYNLEKDSDNNTVVNMDYNKIIDLVNNFKEVNYSPYDDVYRKYKGMVSDFINEKKSQSEEKINNNKEKLLSLNDKIQDLKRKIDKRFRTSLLNSNILKLNTYKENKEEDAINAIYLKKYVYNGQHLYKVYISNNGLKCLEYLNNGNYKMNDCFKGNKKEDINKNQLFRLNIINNEEEYKKLVYNPDNRYPENIRLLNYPIFVIMIPVNNNCLNLYNNKISFEPCKYKITQMFTLNKF